MFFIIIILNKNDLIKSTKADILLTMSHKSDELFICVLTV